MTTELNAPSNLKAINLTDGWAVEDTDGGVWHPSEETQERIQSSEDPAAMAVHLCDTEPMSGTWHN